MERIDPSDFGLSETVADALHDLYVVRLNSIRDTITKARRETGEHIKERLAGRYIRANGWTRSARYYAKRSTFAKLNQATFEEVRAKREGRL